jgi:hypothetical protein
MINPPRVTDEVRDGVPGVRLRHMGSSWFFPVDEAVALAFRIANCVERIRANN